MWLRCGLFPVNSDQVLSDVDFLPESVSHDKRQVVWICDVSPDVLVVDASQVRRSGYPRWSISSVASGKRMPGEVSMTVSPVPPSLDMTDTCTSGVVPMSTQPPVVTSIPAISTATIASREIDVRTGSSEVDPLPRLGSGFVFGGGECIKREMRRILFLKKNTPLRKFFFYTNFLFFFEFWE